MIYRFFYDFYVPEDQISVSDLKKVKKEMDRIVKADLRVVRSEVSRSEAR